MKKTILFFSFLFLLSCLGQISSDLYLPALPVIRTLFNTTARYLQFTIAVFMVGFAVSHLIYGPVSDTIGRKKPLIIGVAICFLGTLLCRFSNNIQWMIIGRLLQGAGAGAGSALFLSILRDVYDGNKLAKISSFLGISRVILLASAPLIGSYLLHFFNWRACFTFLLFYTGICGLAALFIYQETNTHQQKINVQQTLCNYKNLLTHASFMSYAFCVTLAFSGILAWLTTLPFLLQDVVGLTPVQFGWVCTIAGLFFIVGGFINAMIVERYGLQKMLLIGLAVMLSGSLIMLLLGFAGHVTVLAIMLPVFIYIIGCSLVFSNAYAGAMEAFPNIAGTAGALFGFLQILGGAISSFLMSLFENYNQIPLAIVLMASALIALTSVIRFSQNEIAE